MRHCNVALLSLLCFITLCNSLGPCNEWECPLPKKCFQGVCITPLSHGNPCSLDQECGAADRNSTCSSTDKVCECKKGFKHFTGPLGCQDLDFCLTGKDCYHTCTCMLCIHNKCTKQESVPCPTEPHLWPFIVSPILGVMFLLMIVVPVVVKRRREDARELLP